MKPLLLFLTACTAQAQFTLHWYTADAGGGPGAGGNYSLQSTIAQADAGAVASAPAGSFSLQGGYWTFPDLSTPAPVPVMLRDSGFITLLWDPPAGRVVLEVSTDLALWQPVVPQPTGNVWSESETGRRFYRLRPEGASP